MLTLALHVLGLLAFCACIALLGFLAYLLDTWLGEPEPEVAKRQDDVRVNTWTQPGYEVRA